MGQIQQLITDHIDTWTSALAPKSSAGRGSSSKTTHHGIQKLRELILELAVRGKLVPQDPNDEPASVLLEKIAVEKARLVKEKKIKKPKKLPEISKEEKPFSLPKGWAWVRLGEISEANTGYAFKSSQYLNEGTFVLRVTNIEPNGKIDTYDAKYIDSQSAANDYEKFSLEENDVLLVMVGGSLGKIGVVDADCLPAVLNQNMWKLVRYGDIALQYFIMAIRNINANQLEITSSTHGHLSQGEYMSKLFALPPLAEQHRIVAKVDDLMALCDQLEQRQTTQQLTHQTLVTTLLEAITRPGSDDHNTQAEIELLFANFDTLFTTEQSIDQLKQTLLQLAVMGKLVPQDPNDQPASELLQKIAREKVRLIKEKKIKTQQPLPEISDEEKPFPLPQGWEWVRLGDVANIVSGNAFKSSDFNEQAGVKTIKITNAGVGELIETEDYLPASFAKEFDAHVVEKDDLILALTRPYISTGLKVSKCPESYHGALLNQRVSAIKCYSLFISDFAFLVMRSPFVLKTYQDRFGGSGLQPNLKVSDVTELLMPMPPNNEQHRIVAKVDQLMALCDQLKTRLQQAQTTQQHLADAIVEQAVGS